jgi:hypothetical protein
LSGAGAIGPAHRTTVAPANPKQGSREEGQMSLEYPWTKSNFSLYFNLFLFYHKPS